MKKRLDQLSIILDFEGLKMLSTNSVPEIFRVSRCLTERCLTIPIYCNSLRARPDTEVVGTQSAYGRYSECVWSPFYTQSINRSIRP